MAPILALFTVTVVYAIGDIVGTKSKAWIPSVFIVACLFLAGYWSFFPKDIVNLAGMGLPLGLLAIFLCITHMGTIISFKELIGQWRIILITLAGLVGMIIFCWVICIPLVGKTYVISGLPPLTGGIVAALMMQQAAIDKGLQTAAIFAIAMYVMQGFAGYPITAILLKKEGKNLLKKYRSGEKSKNLKGAIKIETDNGKLTTEESGKKKLIPPMPEKYNTTAVILAKLSSIAALAYFIQNLTGGKLNQFVVALLLSVFATEIGYLDKDSLHKAGSFGFLMFVLMIYIFGGLSQATPQILKQIAGPMACIIVVGVIGMGIFSILAGKLLKVSPYMAFATALTALYGFPPNYVLTEEAAKALAQNPEEKEFLMDQMLPQMIVGGFITVTITSVIIAGIFTNLL